MYGGSPKKNGRLPENWEELKTFAAGGHDPYISSHNIESRIEINFELMKKLNTGKIALPTDGVDKSEGFWFYRFYKHPKSINQKRTVKDVFHGVVGIRQDGQLVAV